MKTNAAEERYWLRINELEWQEVTRDEYLKTESKARFKKDGDETAASFTSLTPTTRTDGIVTRGEITQKEYGFDPDFLRIALNKKL